jgi:hypothetical protein
VKTRKADGLVGDLRKMCLRCAVRHVVGIHRLPTRHRGQPRKGCRPRVNGSDSRPQGVQKVLGCLAALSHLISRLGEKGLPLYRLLKKHERFSWTVEAQ